MRAYAQSGARASPRKSATSLRPSSPPRRRHRLLRSLSPPARSARRRARAIRARRRRRDRADSSPRRRSRRFFADRRRRGVVPSAEAASGDARARKARARAVRLYLVVGGARHHQGSQRRRARCCWQRGVDDDGDGDEDATSRRCAIPRTTSLDSDAPRGRAFVSVTASGSTRLARQLTRARSMTWSSKNSGASDVRGWTPAKSADGVAALGPRSTAPSPRPAEHSSRRRRGCSTPG